MPKFRSRDTCENAAREQLENDGYEVMKRGHPDFIAINWDKKEVRFIEVKKVGFDLRPHQLKAKKAYNLAGIKYEVVEVDLGYNKPRLTFK